MAKKINHRGHGGHGELLFSLCPLCPPWFSDPIPEDNKKSHDHGRGSADPISLIYPCIVGISQKPNFIRVNYLQT